MDLATYLNNWDEGGNVTVYGLFNEHFQGYQTLWNGENGRMYFYQCETPYDFPSQEDYMSENGTRPGYVAYKVSDGVKNHYAAALGIYDMLVNEIKIENSIEVPDTERLRVAPISVSEHTIEILHVGISHIVGYRRNAVVGMKQHVHSHFKAYSERLIPVWQRIKVQKADLFILRPIQHITDDSSHCG